MFGAGDIWDKSPSWFLKIVKLPSFYSGNFKIFQNALGQFIPNCPPKHVITSNYKLQGFSKVVKRRSILLQIEAIAKIEVKARVFRLIFLI